MNAQEWFSFAVASSMTVHATHFVSLFVLFFLCILHQSYLTVTLYLTSNHKAKGIYKF